MEQHDQKALLNLNKNLVVSHTDLDQKNVLWEKDGSPLLIDWEGAKLINPMHELITAALDWSGVASLNVDTSILQSMLNEYKKAGGQLTHDLEDAFNVQMGGVNWLVYNLQRSLGEAASSDSEKQLGITESEQTLKILVYISTKLRFWIESINL